MRSRRQAVFGLLGLAVSVACLARPADPVTALVADLEAAAEARDADALVERLSEQYQDGHGLDRTETALQLRRWLAAYESVSLEVYGVEVERVPASARVRCVVEFAGRGRSAFGLRGLLPPDATYRFTLDVADEGGTWRVRGAAYEPVQPPGAVAGPR